MLYAIHYIYMPHTIHNVLYATYYTAGGLRSETLEEQQDLVAWVAHLLLFNEAEDHGEEQHCRLTRVLYFDENLMGTDRDPPNKRPPISKLTKSYWGYIKAILSLITVLLILT